MLPIRICLLLAALAASPCAQTVLHRHALDDGNPASSDAPFGLVMDPDGAHVYVALCGELAPFGTPASQLGSFNNQRVLKVEIATGNVVAQGTTGFFPEEIALALDASGQVERLYVTDGSSGTVTVLDASLGHVATIPLSPCFGATVLGSFPFGIALAPDGRHAVVTTNGGCGFLEIIDTDPASPTYHQVIRTETTTGTFGRPLFLDATRVFAPSTVCDSGFTFCRGAATVFDIAIPGSAVQTPVSPALGFVYDQAVDAALTPDGHVVMTVGFGASPWLVEVDPDTLAITRLLDLSGQAGLQLHGLCVDVVEHYAYLGSLSSASEVTVVDLTTFQVTSSLTLPFAGFASLVNDLVLTPDRTRAVATLQGAHEIAVLGDLPGAVLNLASPAAVPVGAAFDIEARGAESGRGVGLFASLVGGGPAFVAGQPIALTPPVLEIGAEIAPLDGQILFPIALPADPALSGLRVWLQAVTVDQGASLRLSNGTTFLIL